ncbi:PQQ-binding-like beta-propeller repeat protein, partial [bacterium]|nr:PQQ-binding-like beta-propeller repeat protein [bacterium]
MPADLKPVWEKALGGTLSSVVVAGGRLYVASVDTHTVMALDAADGNVLWSYTAGGRVDSPPTIHEGLCLFGSADGTVYCLRASDGVLAWRFRAAPVDQRHMYFEQVESVWPVHGSILVQDGEAYFAAGRSMFLDGGIHLYRLDAKTGRVLSRQQYDAQDPTTGKELQARHQTLQMPVALPDVLSSDGERVYMRSQVLDREGKRLALGPHSGQPAGQGAVQRGKEAHLFAPYGFLDSEWFHRSYWVVGRSFSGGHAGYHQAGKFAPAGRILAADEKTVYGYARKPQYLRWTTTLEYHLFATSREAPEVTGLPAAGKRRGKAAAGSWITVDNAPGLDPSGKPLAVEAWVNAARPDGVVVARGGPAHGYALFLQKGQPQFAVRVSDKVHQVGAKQKVVGKWTHLAGVLAPDKTLEIYVNGKLAGTGKAAGFIAEDPAQTMEIGADDAGGVADYRSPFALTGQIDEVRVYFGRVTADEIAKHHAAPGDVVAKDAKLVLNFSFEKGKARDASGLNHHGKAGAVQATKGKVGKAM